MASVITKQNLHRRHFLRGAGVALGLPLLDAMVPAFARAEINPVPRRFFGIWLSAQSSDARLRDALAAQPATR